MYPFPLLDGVPEKVCLFEFISNKVAELSKPLRVIDDIPWSTPSKAFDWNLDPELIFKYLLISPIFVILKFLKSFSSITWTGEKLFSLSFNKVPVTIISSISFESIKKVTNIKQKSFFLSCICLIIESYSKNITKNFDYKKMLVQIGPALWVKKFN